MWLMTSLGFFSIVQKHNDPFLTIRARLSDDLVQLRDRYMPELSQVIVGVENDYPFRATINHDDFARGIGQIAKDIHYDNFGDEIVYAIGPDREHVYAQTWNTLLKLESDQPVQYSEAFEIANPAKRLSYGGVVINGQSKVLLREPQDHFGGYAWTFPRGSCHNGETPEQAVVREVMGETGIIGRIEIQIPEAFEADSTLNTYFLMSFERETDWEDLVTLRIRWASQEEAEKLIRMTTQAAYRDEDLEVLRQAYKLYHDSKLQ